MAYGINRNVGGQADQALAGLAGSKQAAQFAPQGGGPLDTAKGMVAGKAGEAIAGKVLGAAAAPVLGPLAPLAGPLIGKVLGGLFMDGTPAVPGYAEGTAQVPWWKAITNAVTKGNPNREKAKAGGWFSKKADGTTGMPGYASGTDTVPAMLTPGEAVIPAGAAQNPDNMEAISAMVSEGAAKNDMAPGGQGIMMADVKPMGGPLSGKAKREWSKLESDEERKDKMMMMEERRKQEAHQLKLQLQKQAAAQQAQQSKE